MQTRNFLRGTNWIFKYYDELRGSKFGILSILLRIPFATNKFGIFNVFIFFVYLTAGKPKHKWRDNIKSNPQETSSENGN
jgi:hypothetical protein